MYNNMNFYIYVLLFYFFGLLLFYVLNNNRTQQWVEATVGRSNSFMFCATLFATTFQVLFKLVFNLYPTKSFLQVFTRFSRKLVTCILILHTVLHTELPSVQYCGQQWRSAKWPFFA